MYFDLNVRKNFHLAHEANRLGYKGIAVIQSSDEFNGDYINKFRKIEDDFLILSGVKVYARNPEDMKRKVHEYRAKVDILMVDGGNIKINRAACEDPRVDILANPYKSRRDSGINHIIARKAAENKVALEINLNHILKSRSVFRAKLMTNLREIIKLKHKFSFPVVTTSNANSIYDLRTPEDIITLLIYFGMSLQEAKDSLSIYPLEILEKNKIRKNIIIKGVRVL